MLKIVIELRYVTAELPDVTIVHTHQFRYVT